MFEWLVENIHWIIIWFVVMSQIRFPRTNNNRKYVVISRNKSKWDDSYSKDKIL